MKYLLAIALMISGQCLTMAQVNLLTSEFEVSDIVNSNMHQRASIDVKSFDLKNLAVTSEIDWLTSGGPVSTSMNIRLIDEYSSLDESLDITTSISATAKYLKYNASASFSSTFNNSFKTDEKTISIVIKLESNFGKYGYTNPQLRPEYQSMLANQDYDTFLRQCGTHFVRQSERVVRATAVINIRNLNHSTKQKLTNVFKGKVGGSYGNFSGSVEANKSLQRLINTANNLTEVDVTFQAIGGGGLPALSALVENVNKTDVNQLLSALASFVQSGTKTNSAPIRYYLSSYHQYGLEMDESHGFEPNYLSDVYKKLIEINTTVREISNIKNSRPEYKTYYTDLEEDFERLQIIYKELLGECVNKGNCDSVLPELPSVYWPQNVTTDEEFLVQPTYLPLDKVTGDIRDRILYNLTVRIDGKALFPEYYNRMEFLYLNHNGDLTVIPNFVAGDRVMLDYPFDFGQVRARNLLAQVDYATASLTSNNQGQVVENQANINKAKAIAEQLSKREYYLKSYTTDGKESMTYLGRVNLLDIPLIIRTH